MNCAFEIPSLTGGDQQKDQDWLLIQRVVIFSDAAAFDQLMHRYQSGVKRMLSRFKSIEVDLLDDLVQESFLRAYLSLKKFNGQSRFSTWVYRIAFNLAVDHLRKKTLDTCSVDYLEEMESNWSFQQWELQRDMNAALSELSNLQQEAISLCFGDGYSHSEIANKMNIPLGTVKTHILRARKILEKTMNAWTPQSTNMRYQPL